MVVKISGFASGELSKVSPILNRNFTSEEWNANAFIEQTGGGLQAIPEQPIRAFLFRLGSEEP